MSRHTLLGFNQPESLNDWPLRNRDDSTLHITPTIRSSSGETLRQMALAGVGVVCLSDFMTNRDLAQRRLVQILPDKTLDVRQPINAVYYPNTALSSRITSFVDYFVETPGDRGFEDQPAICNDLVSRAK